MTDLAKTTLGYAFGAVVIAGLSLLSGGSPREAAVLALLGAGLPTIVTGVEQMWPDNNNNREDNR